ncbi:cytokine receptor-like [Teleopsis dalmanni]|uniref:cytokine receptor-like n=1 Tax=Teleopsis dalmanni TaxID=139649 RepID=UPI0018CF0C9F|nr:cytokine receptor-like [Teleopsis dalmanni]
MRSTKYPMESCEPKDSSVYCCYRSKIGLKREFYNFTLESNNYLGTNIQHFSLDLYKNVVPEKLYVEVKNITDKSATLVWNQHQTEFYKEMGLEYEILLRYEGRHWHQYKIVQWNRTLNVNVQLDLPFAYYKYDFKVHVRVAKRPNDDVIPSICFDDDIFNVNNMWSKSFENKFETKSRTPDFAPKTAIGSYYIGQSTTQLYWHDMEKYEKNGATFHYIVREIDQYSSNKFVNQWTTNSSEIILNTTDSRTYTVSAWNEIGESNDKSIIRVFEAETLRNPSNVASVYHNDSYTLKWIAPNELPTNYTVYWCLSAREQQDKCNGTINFVKVNNNETNYTTPPQKVSLNLAVSANYPNYSSGMIWSKCAADILSDLTELSAEVREKSSNNIHIQWSLDNVCISIIKGINITYCPLSSDNIMGKCNNITLSGQVIHYSYNITNLKSYTNYTISIRMYSKTKRGPITTLTERTNESAPSAPRDLRIYNDSVTSKSINISWLPPLEFNGRRIDHYTINFKKINSTIDEHRDILYENVNTTNNDHDRRINFTLGSLNSYTEYEANVTAYTVNNSVASNSVRFKTLIGGKYKLN